LWRPAAVVRDRRGIADRSHADACLIDRTDRGFTSAARAFYPNLDFTHTGLESLPCDLSGRLLSGEGRALPRTAEAASTRRRLGYKIALRIGDRDQRIIERGRDMNDPDGNVLPLLLFKSLFLWCFCHISCRLSVAGCQFSSITDH